MDVLTKEQRKKVMQHIHSQNTSIEVKLRTALWKKNIRYRINYKKLPGSPDIAITKYKIAIFCDSEFFHGKNWDSILKHRLSKCANSEYWLSKIARNIERDRKTDLQLLYEDWTVLHFWGEDINKHLEDCVKAVEEAILEVKTNSTDFLLPESPSHLPD